MLLYSFGHLLSLLGYPHTNRGDPDDKEAARWHQGV
ncbi:hypothetical protein FHT29_004609 [Rhizobium sp. SG741]|nr:hypothetical protein [Rhizobium sp. SG741]NRP90278.1 hypothetical protein [Ensifer adhaerens]